MRERKMRIRILREKCAKRIFTQFNLRVIRFSHFPIAHFSRSLTLPIRIAHLPIANFIKILNNIAGKSVATLAHRQRRDLNVVTRRRPLVPVVRRARSAGRQHHHHQPSPSHRASTRATACTKLILGADIGSVVGGDGVG